MAMIAAYFDESGKKEDHPVVTFCGVCAALPKVNHFSRNWEGLLRHYGLEALHMKYAMDYSTDFGTRCSAKSLSDRIEVLKPFADCINEHLEIGLLQAWDVQGFNALSKPAKKGLGNPDDPYYTAFARGLIELVDYVQEDDRISLICDDDAETAWNCYSHYRAIRDAHTEVNKKTISLAFADDKYFPALQAADMMAWLTRREARLLFYGDSFPMRDLFDYTTAPRKPGKMNWLENFADKEKLKKLSDADWETSTAS